MNITTKEIAASLYAYHNKLATTPMLSDYEREIQTFADAAIARQREESAKANRAELERDEAKEILTKWTAEYATKGTLANVYIAERDAALSRAQQAENELDQIDALLFSEELNYKPNRVLSIETIVKLSKESASRAQRAEKERDEANRRLGQTEGAPKSWNQLFDEQVRICSERDALLASNQRMREALEEVAKGDGAFSLDPLTHAGNVIDKAVATAKAALSPAKGAK